MHIWSMLFSHTPPEQGLVDANISYQPEEVQQITTTAILRETKTRVQMRTATATVTSTTTATATAAPTSHAILPFDDLPPTQVLAHAPGWTLFRNLYMSNGTLFIVADEKQQQSLPEVRLMASTPLEAINSPENIAAREPTQWTMGVITPKEAEERWMMTEQKEKTMNRVWTVEGNTVSILICFPLGTRRNAPDCNFSPLLSLLSPMGAR